ncbi:MAG: rhodanese-related sulfurtransferase [Bacteroidota bacterium]
MEQPYSILLYYCYTQIEDAEEFREAHHRYCLEKGLRGRIIIAHEGINGTISGPQAVCEVYMRDLKADTRFAHAHFKVEAHDQHAFQKLHVRVKPEIVHAGLPHIDPNKKTGRYISPKDFRRIKDDEDVVVIDARSNYEHKLGRFKNAITLDINHFREFPEKANELAAYKDKKVVTYCTGGIKCEKASAYLLEQGFKDVYQLHGGIIQYGLDTDGEGFEGQCYVFDNRLATSINKKDPSVVSECYVCHKTCGRMVNCANAACNVHVPICEACGDALEGACSPTCQQHPAKRPYDGTGYYATKMNGYNPYKGSQRRQKQVTAEGSV